MGYSRKNPQPHATEGMLENLVGGGVNSSGNSAGGGSEPKNTLCILGFQATWPLTRALPPLCIGKLPDESQSISEATAGCEHNSAQWDNG